jgi:8-oxo-dGTP pyrophosphatase MutT (NUDIX family)
MTDPARPRQAASVILLRRAEPAGFKVFLTRRPEGMRFLGGMYCFPGGAVQREDHSTRLLDRCRGVSARQARRIFGAQVSPRETWAFWIAAIRELFEETGVLLATYASGEQITGDLSARHRAMSEKSYNLAGLLETDDLYCDLSRLVYFSRWQTPADNPVRFDTRFFLAVLPEEQIPLPISQEVIHSVWLTPDDALQRCERGELPMIFPTFASLRTLADFNDLESVMEEFSRRYR